MEVNTVEYLGCTYSLEIVVCYVFTILKNMSDDRRLCFDAVYSSASDSVTILTYGNNNIRPSGRHHLLTQNRSGENMPDFGFV
jgi:hypothetical protein